MIPSDKVVALLTELRRLHVQASYRANLIFENGREISDEARAGSAGYASAYHYCIMRLEMDNR